MDTTERSAPSALSFIFGMLAFVLCARGESSTGADPTRYRSVAAEGARELRAGENDSALDRFMEAHRLGMSKDSLYFFLAEAALSHSAFDTAMAFNLSIPSPQGGEFREAVLDQRYRLYLRAGLDRDAAAIADSLAVKPSAAGLRRRELDVQFFTGYFREDEYPMKHYPFGTDLGRFQSEGPHFRHRARLLHSLPAFGKIRWKGGFGYDLVKSYAKDSLDYRAGLHLLADHLFLDSLSTTVSAHLGRVTGTGLVSNYKLESSYLAFSEKAITMLQAGLESEYDVNWGNRFSAAWASWYRDHSLRTGRGANFSLSVSAIRVDPIRQASDHELIYVDDVSKAAPTHFRDEGFTDSLPRNSIATFQQYRSNIGNLRTSTLSPQGFLTLLPTVGYTFPVPGGFSGSIGGQYVLAYYPQAYTWAESEPASESAGSLDDFQGFALNKADGKRYAAFMIRENGGFREGYASAPLRSRKRRRIDNQAGADLSLRRSLSAWGSITLDAMVKRNWTSLAGMAPLWIPEWDMGAALRWSRNWGW